MDSLALNLKKLRAGRLLTQKQVAEGTGISVRTLIRWELGQGEPGASELLALARCFGIGIDQLVSDLLPTNGTAALPKPSTLSGEMLDYWVAKARGLPVMITPDGPVMYEVGIGQTPVPRFSAELSIAEPLMYAKGMQLQTLRAGGIFDGETKRVDGWVARCEQAPTAYWGATIPEAAARAWLAAEAGALLWV